MYELKKIVIIGNYDLEDDSDLKTVALETSGLCVNSLLYIGDRGSCIDKKATKAELKDELYSDQYDEDSLKIYVKEAYNGEDAVDILLKYIEKKWDKDTLVYYYNPNDEIMDCLCEKSPSIDCRLHIEDYYDIFGGKPAKDIYTIMEENGLNLKNLLKDSYISLAYFLSTLVEVMLSR